MRLFFVQLIGSTLFATLSVAEHKWPGSFEYHGYHGPPAPLSHDGRVLDTPEVAHAKAAHLAAHAEVTARMSEYDHYPIWEGHDEVSNHHEGHQPPYHGPLAPLGHDGRVIDTPEVAEARAAHLAAHADAAAKAPPDEEQHHILRNDIWDGHDLHDLVANHHASFKHYSPKVYKGPPAPLAPDGRVLDTPEVAHAKEAHLRAHAHAAALTAHQEHEFYYIKH